MEGPHPYRAGAAQGLGKSGISTAKSRPIAAVPQVSESAKAWERFREFAEAKGWTVELTPRGRTRCAKNGSIVLGPGHGASDYAYRDLIARLGYFDGFMNPAGRR